ncbi:hypothetical protein VB774_13405 [Pseudanabaena galeata UHCC 0370]|uniref:Uncharacterized protein n=1 Tax=Pseudanabaena galeata UHCC 0370 TaxID=3110310 RepID=A0ABU5TK24_9CYAN|nr:hypothetical protein [Pseudanabaena galeata]MEA5478619.1 hypothetical protein [Pseudanabaena galeata UHCC 0370]
MFRLKRVSDRLFPSNSFSRKLRNASSLCDRQLSQFINFCWLRPIALIVKSEAIAYSHQILSVST